MKVKVSVWLPVAVISLLLLALAFWKGPEWLEDHALSELDGSNVGFDPVATEEGLGISSSIHEISTGPNKTAICGTIEEPYLHEDFRPVSDSLRRLGIELLVCKHAEQLTSLEGLENIPTLHTITIWNAPRLTSLAGMSDLPALETLSVSDCPRLISLSGASGLPALVNLTLDDCDRLTTLAEVHEFPGLKTLSIGLDKLITPNGLQGHPGLESLDFQNCHMLSSLEGIADLPKLDYLLIANTPALTSLKGLGELPSLDQLFIESAPALRDLTGAGKLPAVNLFFITTSGLESLEGIGNFPNLGNVLVKSGRLTDITGLSDLTSVRKLRLEGCTAISDEQLSRLRGHLPTAVITLPDGSVTHP